MTVMKNIILTLGIFFTFSAFAQAQEEKDKTQREPPTITQAQVEKDARMADEERKKHQLKKEALTKEKQKKEEDNKLSNKSSTKKTSTRPGKQ